MSFRMFSISFSSWVPAGEEEGVSPGLGSRQDTVLCRAGMPCSIGKSPVVSAQEGHAVLKSGRSSC